jgi:hypothetical protein
MANRSNDGEAAQANFGCHPEPRHPTFLIETQQRIDA